MRRLLAALILLAVAGCAPASTTVATPPPTTGAAAGAGNGLVSFGRFGAQFPPERETLTVDADGGYELWRSFAGPVVGRFAGTVDELDALTALVTAAREEPPPPPPGDDLPPDASVEVVGVGAQEVEVVAGAPVEGAWGALLTRLRELLDELAGEPVAAVRAVLVDPGTLRLEHLGSEPLPLHLAALTVQLERHDGGLLVASATVTPEGLGAVTAEPGWTLDIPLDADVVDGPGAVTARATFIAVDQGVNVPVSVTATS